MHILRRKSKDIALFFYHEYTNRKEFVHSWQLLAVTNFITDKIIAP